jgi:uncharacterized membrane protein
MLYIKFLIVPMFLVFWFQLYSYAIGRQGEERQTTCKILGIFSFTLGVLSLLTHDYLLVSTGLILMMFGFRLMSYGLDRLDKKVFIDNYKPSSSE